MTKRKDSIPELGVVSIWGLSVHEWRPAARGGHYERYISEILYTGSDSFTIADLSAGAKRRGIKVADAKFELETEWDYGQERSVIKIEGWMRATDDEVLLAQNQRRQMAQELEDRDEQQLAALRARRPDLFEE